MPVTASDLKIQIRGSWLSQQVQVIQWYRPSGAAFLTTDLVGVAEAFWNDIKTVWRACHVNNSLDVTTSILISEPGAGGGYAEFPIPTGEQQGTRSAPASGDAMPPYVAQPVRLTVPTRTTRPGQKRFWGLYEADYGNGILLSGYKAIVDALAPKFASDITLGAPVATGVLTPEIVRTAGVPAVVTARQDISGFLTMPNCSSQNSRKYGRGS